MGLVLFEDPRDGSEMRSGIDGQDGALGPLSGCRANEQAGHVVLTRTTACALKNNIQSAAEARLYMHVIVKLKSGHSFCQIKKQRKPAVACPLGKHTHSMHVHPETNGKSHALDVMQCTVVLHFFSQGLCSNLKSALIWTEGYSSQTPRTYQHDNLKCRRWPILPASAIAIAIAITSSGRASVIPSHRTSNWRSSPHPFCAPYPRDRCAGR